MLRAFLAIMFIATPLGETNALITWNPETYNGCAIEDWDKAQKRWVCGRTHDGIEVNGHGKGKERGDAYKRVI